MFCFPLKEEFRELREQPSDPQAEQELINSIEQVYFSTDSFDKKCYPPEYVVSGPLKRVESGLISGFQTQKFHFNRRT